MYVETISVSPDKTLLGPEVFGQEEVDCTMF